jgi:phage terminase large subunit-like protein
MPVSRSLDWRELRETMRGRECFGALDLSSRTDLTALALLFKDHDSDDMTVIPFFWVPEEGAEKRSRTDRVPYQEWIRNGLLIATPGNVVDQGFIREDIYRLAKDYRLKELAFDPWNASKLSIELQGDGIQVVEMRQGFRSLSEATKHLGALVTGRKLRHGAHPVLRWMASNMVVRQDPNGNLAPDKSKVTERIDGIVALIMAIAVALVNQDTEPTYQVLVYGGRP